MADTTIHSWHNISTNTTLISLDKVTIDDISSILKNFEKKYKLVTWEESVASLYDHLITLGNPHQLTADQLSEDIFDKIYQTWITAGHHGSKQELIDIIFRFIPVLTGEPGPEEVIDDGVRPMYFQTNIGSIYPEVDHPDAPAYIYTILNKAKTGLNVLFVTINEGDSVNPSLGQPLALFDTADALPVEKEWDEADHDWLLFSAVITNNEGIDPPIHCLVLGLPPTPTGRPQLLFLGAANPVNQLSRVALLLEDFPWMEPKLITERIPLDMIAMEATEIQSISVLALANYLNDHDTALTGLHQTQLTGIFPGQAMITAPSLTLHRLLDNSQQLTQHYVKGNDTYELSQLFPFWNMDEGTVVLDLDPIYTQEIQMHLSIEASNGAYQIYTPPDIQYVMCDVPTSVGIDVHTVQFAGGKRLSYVFSYRRDKQTSELGDVICGVDGMLRTFHNALIPVSQPKIHIGNLFNPTNVLRAVTYYPKASTAEQCRMLTGLLA